jgi:hypothetical protein
MSESRLQRLAVASAEYGIRCRREDSRCRIVKLEARYPRSRERLQQRSWVDIIGESWWMDFGCWTVFVLRGSGVMRRHERERPRE